MGQRAVAIIQARMSSTRLPGKVLLPLAGKPVIWHVVDRLKRCERVERIVVATSLDASDDVLAEYLKAHAIECHRGNLENVLQRFLDVLRATQYSLFVRVTADCPLIEPKFIDEQICALEQFDGDVIWLGQQTSVLEGQGVRSARSLRYIHERSTSSEDQEHVGSIYLSRHPEEFRIVEMHIPREYCIRDVRLTLDEDDDYKMFSEIYGSLWKDRPVDLLEALEWLKANPGVTETNRSVKHSVINQEVRGYFGSWVSAPKVGVYRW